MDLLFLSKDDYQRRRRPHPHEALLRPANCMPCPARRDDR